MACKVISFINMKGGVGKTTLTKELGYHLSHVLDNKVLLIDVDPQMNLTQSLFQAFGYAPSQDIAQRVQMEELSDQEEGSRTKRSITVSSVSIASIFSGTITSPATPENSILKLDDNLSIVPGQLGIDFSLRNLNSTTLENGIYEFIKKHHLREQFDFIFIDCPPTYSSYTTASLKASDAYLIPAKPEAYSILGVDMLLKVVDSVQIENGPYFEPERLKNIGIILTDMRGNSSVGERSLTEDLRKSKLIVNSNVYFFNTQFAHNEYIKTQIDYLIDRSNADKTSKPNLANLAQEFLGRIDDLWNNN